MNNNMQGMQQGTQGIRQVSPEEVQQQSQGVIPMTREELQKTQVLNLQDVEEAARLDKLTSKKPAIIIAIIGALFLTFGTTFQIVKILSTPKETNKVQKRENRDLIESNLKKQKTVLNCTLTALNNPDGTDTLLNIKYDFEEDKLIGFTRTFSVTPIANNPVGQQTLQGYVVGYQSFMNQVDGYKITVTPNDQGLVAIVQVDLEKLDMTTLAPVQQTHFSTSVQYSFNTEKDQIKTDMINQGYVCE